jgi:hypothetical protein
MPRTSVKVAPAVKTGVRFNDLNACLSAVII